MSKQSITTSFFSLLILLFSCSNYGQIDADIDSSIYYQDQTPFVDVSFHIVGSSLTQRKLDKGMVESRVNVLITVTQENEIIDFRKFGLISPTAVAASDFIDLKRFSLQPGKYTLNVELTDQLDNSNRLSKTQAIDISPWEAEAFASDMQLLYEVTPSEDTSNPFYKYGFILLPTAYNFYHSSMDRLIVFNEFYSLNSIQDETIVAKISISNIDRSDVDPLVKYKKLEKLDKEVLIESFNINEMISGNYEIKVEIINKRNEILIASNQFFQRSNPSYDAEILVNSEVDLNETFVGALTNEDLRYNLKALAPVLPQSEVTILNLLLSENNIEGQKFFLFNYWNTYNPVKPVESFEQFREIAKAVDIKYYSTVGRGFETDRGYIFLRYGRPNNIISVENEPSAPPYEIWFYDKLDLTGETNMKFLFYNPSLGGNDYQLLHSTSRYEKQNRQWEIELYSDAPKDIVGNRVDATTVVDNVNRRAREYFEDNN